LSQVVVVVAVVTVAEVAQAVSSFHQVPLLQQARIQWLLGVEEQERSMSLILQQLL
jgi:hypothetical protein